MVLTPATTSPCALRNVQTMGFTGCDNMISAFAVPTSSRPDGCASALGNTSVSRVHRCVIVDVGQVNLCFDDIEIGTCQARAKPIHRVFHLRIDIVAGNNRRIKKSAGLHRLAEVRVWFNAFRLDNSFGRWRGT